MFLQRLEIHGFKSFAQKTVLEFLPPQDGRKSLTAVVGPNGSGKSNIADAVRWVLGEQSLKTLRGKKSEDVIFAGSEKRARLGLAEVSLTLNNEDGEAPWEMSEAVITRRLYRDGESEYLVNGRPARLQDIALLLARARFGTKTYTVIGQGMIDAFLLVSAVERKEFFDEAAGVKEFQIKRQQALSKLQATQENLTQAMALLAEIEPRLRSLNRQVKRLAERELVEKELRELQKQYYSSLWQDLAERLGSFSGQYQRLDEIFQRRRNEHHTLLNQLNALEKETSTPLAFLEMKKKYEEILARRNDWQEKKLKFQSQIEIAKARAMTEKIATPLPISLVIEELEALLDLIKKLERLKDLQTMQSEAQKLSEKMAALLGYLKNPRIKQTAEMINPQLVKESEEAETELTELAQELTRVNQQMQWLGKEEEKKKDNFFELQRALQAKQEETHGLEQNLNNIKVELAKLETRRETLEQEINLELGPLGAEVKLKSPATALSAPTNELQPRIYKFKHQLELIGGIDAEAVAEHKETKERFDFLSTQIIDLQKAYIDTTAVAAELDKIMKERRGESLKKINEEFGKFFKLLFNGGQAKLAPLFSAEETEDENEDEGAVKVERAKAEPVWAGIEIQATPPGKRIKDINVLSGGERALTSVALLCAILSNSPSPFVVLDEVDAALDESNSIRFAEILAPLADRTQIIIVTHNRATMAKARALYGVTMNDDGASRLLSVKLEEAEKMVRE